MANFLSDRIRRSRPLYPRYVGSLEPSDLFLLISKSYLLLYQTTFTQQLHVSFMQPYCGNQSKAVFWELKLFLLAHRTSILWGPKRSFLFPFSMLIENRSPITQFRILGRHHQKTRFCCVCLSLFAYPTGLCQLVGGDSFMGHYSIGWRQWVAICFPPYN